MSEVPEGQACTDGAYAAAAADCAATPREEAVRYSTREMGITRMISVSENPLRAWDTGSVGVGGPTAKYGTQAQAVRGTHLYTGCRRLSNA